MSPREIFRNRLDLPIRCGQSSVAFCESFDDVPSAVRGRGGDLDPAIWGAYRFTPDGVDAYPAATHNHVRTTTIPACRSTFTDTVVYPPYDILICDPSGSRSSRLMTSARIQYYGQIGFKARQPFDFASRTGTIWLDVDAVSEGTTETWVNVSITEDPVPAHTFLEAGNHETGPQPKNAVMIAFAGNGPSGRVTVENVNVYADYAMTTLTPTFSVSGTDKPAVNAGDLNHIEIRISTTSLQVWESDYSTDDEVTFPNFRKIYEATLSLGWSRGYVHFVARNHATEKFSGGSEHIYFWDRVAFDGPLLTAPRAYEIPDNGVIGTRPPDLPLEPGYDYMRLAYEVSDGTNKAEGVWNGNGTKISPLTFTGSVDVTGATSAQLTLNLFILANGAADTTMGLKYKFNGGTWRTRTLTAGEVGAVNNAGSAGNLSLVIDVLVADLTSGTNTIDFSTVNISMGYPPLVMNIDLLVNT